MSFFFIENCCTENMLIYIYIYLLIYIFKGGTVRVDEKCEDSGTIELYHLAHRMLAS